MKGTKVEVPSYEDGERGRLPVNVDLAKLLAGYMAGRGVPIERTTPDAVGFMEQAQIMGWRFIKLKNPREV